MAKILLNIGIFLGMVFLFSSCVSTKPTTYFLGAQDTMFLAQAEEVEPRIQPNDILSISISSLSPDPAVSAMFNAPNASNTVSTTSAGSTASTSGYLVSADGMIQLPVLGYIKAAGLTISRLKTYITNTIVEKKLLLDPIVNIRHLNFEVTVIGEVAHPTVISVPNEKISLLKALGLAGDITVYGKKDNVLLIREDDGRRQITRIDMNSKKFLSSPNYYLQPGDIIYVEANKDKVENASNKRNILPTVLSGLSVLAIVLDRVIK
ncbi:MAG: polysaccharide biosynthesis/export family protein [Bacteroidetes bacterium]|nr:polysaccharide biosynthesis/export family protein [Bacteroidota bacterium]MBS1756749.1 polysaccharide biosynthesis/export family protein [Bacteroidota bacterium]